MGRDYYINGESMVTVKGMTGTGIATLQQLGLSTDPIVYNFEFRHRDIIVDAHGPELPADVQAFLAAVNITINFIHFDPAILDICQRESLGGGAGPGTMTRAGTRLGGGVDRFQAGNHYIGLNVSSPVQSKPYRFLHAYLTGPAVQIPVGTEKSVVSTNWRCIPYQADPWGNGLGAQGLVVWDNTADT